MTTPRDLRQNIRVSFKTEVTIYPLEGNGTKVITQKTRDISLKGVYCYTDKQFPKGTRCLLELRLTGMTSDCLLKINAIVVRTDREGMAFRFEEMDIDTFSHLKQILYYNTGDPERIDHEIRESIKKK